MTDKGLSKIAKRITALREEKGWTKEQLANFMDCPASLITYYESGQRAPGSFNLIKLMRLFDETADFILGETDIRRLKKETHDAQ